MALLRWGLNHGRMDIIGLGDAADKTARNRFIIACNAASAWLYSVITNTVVRPLRHVRTDTTEGVTGALGAAMPIQKSTGRYAQPR
jgi:hypothetical protein